MCGARWPWGKSARSGQRARFPRSALLCGESGSRFRARRGLDHFQGRTPPLSMPGRELAGRITGTRALSALRGPPPRRSRAGPHRQGEGRDRVRFGGRGALAGLWREALEDRRDVRGERGRIGARREFAGARPPCRAPRRRYGSRGGARAGRRRLSGAEQSVAAVTTSTPPGGPALRTRGGLAQQPGDGGAGGGLLGERAPREGTRPLSLPLQCQRPEERPRLRPGRARAGGRRGTGGVPPAIRTPLLSREPI